MVSQHEIEIGDRNERHSFSIECRQASNGTWTHILVHADSRLKAAKLAIAEGYNLGGGDTQQVR